MVGDVESGRLLRDERYGLQSWGGRGGVYESGCTVISPGLSGGCVVADAHGLHMFGYLESTRGSFDRYLE
jgi:hypothetical protein